MDTMPEPERVQADRLAREARAAAFADFRSGEWQRRPAWQQWKMAIVDPIIEVRLRDEGIVIEGSISHYSRPMDS